MEVNTMGFMPLIRIKNPRGLNNAPACEDAIDLWAISTEKDQMVLALGVLSVSLMQLELFETLNNQHHSQAVKYRAKFEFLYEITATLIESKVMKNLFQKTIESLINGLGYSEILKQINADLGKKKKNE